MMNPYPTLHAALLAERTPPVRWIIDGLFLEAGCGILGGAPKTGKSFFALDLAVSVASGTACAGHFAVEQSGPVLLLCAEDPDAVVSSRLVALAFARGLKLADIPIEVIVGPIARLPEGLGRLADTLAVKKPRLLVLDPLIRLHHADENSASEMSVILDGLRGLARQSRCAVLLVHHARKATGSSGGSGLRGSSDMHAFGDSNLYLRGLPQNGLLELRAEHRAAAPSDPMRLRLEVDKAVTNARFTLLTDAKQPDPLAERVLALIAAATEPLSCAALREKLGVRNQAVALTIKTLETAGRIRRLGRDGWTTPAST